MIFLNTNFENRHGKKKTFIYPNKVGAQLDYIPVNRKWNNEATNSKADNSTDCVGSD